MRILIADSRPSVCHALAVLLSGEPGWQVVGTAAEAGELADRVAALRPHVVLVDWGLPGLCPEAFLARLRRQGETVAIVMSANPELRRRALQCGADQFVSKVDAPRRVIEAILACLPAASRPPSHPG